ncbi:MAG: RluA family pseudouridine synthase [Lentisphaeria bacterium]|nr:RluA family pseudouridine synthase [Lentisphaeria bacterium]
MKRIAKTRIRTPWAGRTLLDMLGTRFPYHSRAGWADLVERGDVLLNGVPAQVGDVLRQDDEVEYRVPDLPEPPVDMHFQVLLEDDALLLVDKPGNLPCHPAGRFFNHTLWALLRARLHQPTLHFVSRLDRETSGIVLVTRTPNAATHCQRQARGGRMRKEYLAIVEGTFDHPCHARGWILPEPAGAIRRKLCFVPGEEAPAPTAARAETWFEPLRTARDLTLIRARLGTGRTHQIRCTLAALGTPVVGDKLYGRDAGLYLRYIHATLTADDRRTLRLDRQALHASRLAFDHPATGRRMDVASPLPAPLTKLLGT